MGRSRGSENGIGKNTSLRPRARSHSHDKVCIHLGHGFRKRVYSTTFYTRVSHMVSELGRATKQYSCILPFLVRLLKGTLFRSPVDYTENRSRPDEHHEPAADGQWRQSEKTVAGARWGDDVDKGEGVWIAYACFGFTRQVGNVRLLDSHATYKRAELRSLDYQLLGCWNVGWE